jgi:hypothetical protein
MFPDDESSEEHPDSFYQDDAYDEDDEGGPSGKGCLIAMAIILILSMLLRFLQ